MNFKDWLTKHRSRISRHAWATIGLVLVVCLLWFLWGVLGVSLFKRWICPDTESCAALGQVGDVFGGVNALFAAIALAAVAYSTDASRRAFREEQRRNQDAEYLAQIRKSYGWAYAVLADEGVAANSEGHRLAWLTCARHLVRAAGLVKAIQKPTYKVLQAEEEEYWRHKFYQLLSGPKFSTGDFFSASTGSFSPTSVANEKIEVTSALVVVAFSAWKEGAADPLESVDRFELIERRGVLGVVGAGRGLEAYLTQFPHIVKEWDRRRAAEGKPVPKRSWGAEQSAEE